MNAPSPSKRKQSSSAKVPCRQSQSTTPRNHHNKLPFHLPRGPQHQIGQYHIQSTTTTLHTHLQCHYLRSKQCHHLCSSQCQCYQLCNTPTHGRGAPRPYHHHQSLNKGRYQKEQATHPPAAWLMPSLEDPMSQYMRRRGNAKNTSELSLM